MRGFPTRANMGRSKSKPRGRMVTETRTKTVKSTKCGRRLANDVGTCDRAVGHAGAHSNAWLRKNGPV
jgi:hypothetical protein